MLTGQCSGKISNITVNNNSDNADAPRTAVVQFEKETAAKTALLLDNTQLGSAFVHVTSNAAPGATSTSTSAGTTGAAAAAGTTSDEHDDNLSQEDKPRSRILAEYLAHGYVVSDKAIERAIALDQQHGVSNRFMSALQNFDAKYGVSEKTAQVDQKLGVSDRAHQGWLGLNSYFEAAVNTPTGQRVRAFYDQGSKQVLDVHNEAKHLASLKTGKPEGSILSGVPSAEQAQMEKVQIDGKGE